MPGFISNTIQAHIAFENIKDGSIEYLALKRSSEALIYPSTWQVITGTLEPGETAIQAAVREIDEETSLEIVKIWTLPYVTVFFDTYSDLTNFSPVFGVIVKDKSALRLSDEHTDFKWLDFGECSALLALPSHKKGTEIFLDFILSQKNRDMFLIKPEKYKNER